MSRTEHPEDLLVLARQCRLEDEDERRLQLAVQSSRELDALYQAGLEFDAESSLLPGDETRSSALVERTLARLDAQGGAGAFHGTRSGRGARAGSARYFAVSVAVGVLLSVALASAWEVARRSMAAPSSSSAAPSGVAPAPVLQTHAVSAVPQPSGAGAPSAPFVSPVASGAPVPVRAASSRALPVPFVSPVPGKNDDVEALGPSRLFAHANELRRQGDGAGAIAAYQRLCELYPSSVEAEDAKLLLGNLLLGQRAPRAALQSFEDYGAGALSLEASWGRAQALRKLESPDERGALERLLRDFPGSPYTKAAQKRLQELAR